MAFSLLFAGWSMVRGSNSSKIGYPSTTSNSFTIYFFILVRYCPFVAEFMMESSSVSFAIWSPETSCLNKRILTDYISCISSIVRSVSEIDESI